MNIQLPKPKDGNRGTILVFSVLYLTTISIIVMGITAVALPKIRAISDLNASDNALFVADSALEWCLFNQRGKVWPVGPPNTLTMGNGATFMVFNASISGDVLVASSVIPTPDPAPSGCKTSQDPANHRAIGIFHGVTRSAEISP